MKYAGTVCAKGHAGIQHLYDPYRVKQPLKRAGPRGSGQWKSITWETAMNEIINGGVLPGARKGEADYTFEGLNAIRVFVSEDDTIAAYEAARAAAGVDGSIESITDFTGMVKADRDLIVAQLDSSVADKLIDPTRPEFGPKANQLVHTIGRAEHGKKEFTDVFFKTGFGTNNYRNEHTDICELPRHDANALIRGKTKAPMDYVNGEYVMFWGSSRLEAGFPFQAAARKVMRGIEDGNLKMAVVDPRFSATAAKADTWVPIKPGYDGALAMGMMRWIMDNTKYDKTYLENTCYGPAHDDDEDTWSDATYLINTDTRKYLKPADVGLTVPAGATEVGVVWDGTALQAVYKPDGEKYKSECDADHGVLDYSGTAGAAPVKTTFLLLKEAAEEHTLDEYAALAGVEKTLIETLASDFTSHGKKAVAEHYRGPAQHTNGFWSAFAIAALNTVIGNSDHKGGIVYGGHQYYEFGAGKDGSFWDIKGGELQPAYKMSPWGVKVSRGGNKYEDTCEFSDNGYPASHLYFPVQKVTGHYKNVSHACIEGVCAQYPYPTKALMTTKANYNYSMPGMKDIINDKFTDSSVLPLFVAFDIIVGEFSALSDYILPDGTYLEQFGTPHPYYSILTKASGVRTPVVPPLYPGVKIEEQALIEIGIKMGLPGFGTGGLGPAGDLNKMEDWYHALIANIGGSAAGYGKITELADIATDKDALVEYLKSKGGVFEPWEKAYDDDGKPHHKWKYKKSPIKIYAEGLATLKDCYSGEYFSGVPKWMPPTDAAGNSLDDDGYDFKLITYKPATQTQSRTAACPWLMNLQPENYIEINTEDAESLSIENGDLVRLSSKTNEKGVIGKAMVTEGLRPGVVAVSHSFGHWQYGAAANTIDGSATGYDRSRSGGLTPNPVMRVDTTVGGMIALTDKVGAGAVFYDTSVRIERL